jgi:hypothetical protein
MSRHHICHSIQPLWWLLTNNGIPRGIFTTRKAAMADAVKSTGEPWSETGKNFEVRKVWISEYPVQKPEAVRAPSTSEGNPNE